MVGQPGSQPAEFFEDVVDELKSEFKQHKVMFKQLLKDHSIKPGVNISYEQFSQKLQAYAEFSALTEQVKELLFDYYNEKMR